MKRMGTAVSLYSSIPHNKAMLAVKYHLDKYSGYFERVRDFILEAIWYLLTQNYFAFNVVYYLQSRGTAMGAHFTPMYANLFLGWWEEIHVLGGHNPNLEHIVMYCQFINDLLFVWKGTEECYSEFIPSLENVELNLKYTSCFSTDNIIYLDLSDLYQGWENSHNCAYQAMLRDKFLEKVYDMNTLQDTFKSALLADKERLIKSNEEHKRDREHTSTQPVTLRMKYSNQFGQIKAIVNKNLPVLYDGHRFINFACTPLQLNWCITCSVIQVRDSFECSATHEKYRVNEFINCNTKSVVYLLTWGACYKQYVGCTIRPLKERMREHINSNKSVILR
ncbi:hypothetical protein XELAEV_18023480mg [Xenopus laevis]|uniref:Reverse transcriptase domain-containing protein n=1 Tax=Xenopus laevis TaxID=8355 RepID=A0A974D639_XENLA|nr:hypothetical protein XELAEV_18023480mg [Xenopus laevis]